MRTKRALFHFALSVLASAWIATAALAAGPRYQISVSGLACPFCAYGIEKKLSAIKGVDGVETNIAEGIVIVTMADGATLDKATATRAVKDAGFTLKGFAPVGGGRGAPHRP